MADLIVNRGLVEPGTFWCFQGTLGSGKTLSMSICGALASFTQPVYANYETSFARPIESIAHLFQLRDAVLLLDEFQSMLDSREFKKNVELTQWILIVRKLGLSIFYTTQFLGQVDLRVRHVTERVFCCQKSRYFGQKASKITRVDWAGEGGRINSSFVVLHQEALYRLYNTRDYKVKLTSTGRESTFVVPENMQLEQANAPATAARAAASWLDFGD